MSITIKMSAQEIAALKQLTRLDNDGEAIIQAAREFLRLGRLRELKAVSGKVQFETQLAGIGRAGTPGIRAPAVMRRHGRMGVCGHVRLG